MDNNISGPLPDFDGGILKQEMVTLVFLKSSTRSLARFRLVSKTWDNFLSHVNFARLYSKTAMQKHDNFLAVAGLVKESRKLLIISKNPYQDLDIDMVKLPETKTKMVAVGSCNGLICLATEEKPNVMIWNPVTKEEKLIRLPPTDSSLSDVPTDCFLSDVGYGLGYDYRYDYKVFRIVYQSTFPFESLVQIFSVNADSWKDCRIIPFYTDAPNSSFNIEGVPYWVGVDGGGLKKVICSFDPNSEIYQEYDFPSGIDTSLVHVVNIKDNISALVHANKFVEIHTLDKLSSTWVKGIKTGPLDIWFDICSMQSFKVTGDIVALGGGDSEMIFHNNSDNKTLQQLGMGTDSSFHPDWTGAFPHKITLARIQPKAGNEKVEAQTQPKLVLGTLHNIYNCCLEAENKLENLLPTLLLPVAGKEVYSEEDTSKMPLELGSALLIEREPVDDPKIRIEALEAIYLIALKERGRRALWSVNGQRILQVGVEYEQNPEVIEAYKRVGSLLLQGSDIEDTSTKAS